MDEGKNLADEARHEHQSDTPHAPVRAKNPASLWKKGVSANPGGRPKGRSIQAEFRHILDEYRRTSDKTKFNLMLRKIVEKAVRGNLKAAEIIMDRLEGKPSQSVRIGSEDGDTINFIQLVWPHSTPALPAPTGTVVDVEVSAPEQAQKVAQTEKANEKANESAS